jgi:hypothetical protein
VTDISGFAERYLSGRELWGDDFGAEKIEQWFADEREAYADLGASAGEATASTDSGTFPDDASSARSASEAPSAGSSYRSWTGSATSRSSSPRRDCARRL